MCRSLFWVHSLVCNVIIFSLIGSRLCIVLTLFLSSNLKRGLRVSAHFWCREEWQMTKLSAHLWQYASTEPFYFTSFIPSLSRVESLWLTIWLNPVTNLLAPILSRFRREKNCCLVCTTSSPLLISLMILSLSYSRTIPCCCDRGFESGCGKSCRTP